MTTDSKFRLLEDLNRVVSQLPSVVSCQLGSTNVGGQLQIKVLLDTYSVECTRKGHKKHVHMPKNGVFDLRLVTNPIRRVFRKAQVEYSITSPNRHYKSRSATVNEFLGYECPEIILDIF
jgi:hypothetical protein